ncbi:hypothetical protein SO802_012086 [Lithocarpus litseifolius]|uniref:Uncharacterized protein n=1 Tax=Lithocarpus litseifolius TaxID=425828 RepID=A0AAW2D5U8_9ROSI
MHKDRDCDLWLGMKHKASLDKKQFGSGMKAKMDYSSRKSWSSGVACERVEVSQSRKSMPPLVKECPIKRLSSMDAGVPRSETSQPDMATRIVPDSTIPGPTLLRDDSELQNVNGPSLAAAFFAENKRPPLVDFSNSSGPKGKSKANNKGTWSRLDRKPTSSPSDTNMSDLSRERPALNETEPKTKKRRASSSHGRTPSASSLAVAVAQPRRSP